jgi:ureidoacrylate peracid hydrolase
MSEHTTDPKVTIPIVATAAVIIDMQNGFCHPEGSFAQVGADVGSMTAAIAGCVRIVDAARAAGIPVVYTRAIHQPRLADWKILSELRIFSPFLEKPSCLEGSWDAELVDELKVADDERLFEKSRYSPFVETDIEKYLRDELGVENLVIGGVGTSVCVESSVRDASQREFRTYVATDATGDIAQSSHEGSLHIMGSMFGWLTTVDDVVAAWAPSTSE